MVKSNLVAVASPSSGLNDVSGFNQILDDAMHGPLANSNQKSDLGEAHLGVFGDADQHMRMVGKKRPRRQTR